MNIAKNMINKHTQKKGLTSKEIESARLSSYRIGGK